MRIEMTPQGELLSVYVAGEPLVDFSKMYRVATSDYLAQGNDKMTALALGTDRVVLYDVTLRDIMIQYIKELAEGGEKVIAECDGRIKIIE